MTQTKQAVTNKTLESMQAETRAKLLKILMYFFPFLRWLPRVGISSLKFDVYAAISSAIFALPQGLAFALIAGLPPEFGLYAAIVAPVVSALFGSSWHTVSGPTVSTSIVLIGMLATQAAPQSPEYIKLVLMLTLMAGVIQLLLGIFRLGHIVNFISHTVIMGFSTGAAVLIMGNQLKGVLGLDFERQGNILLTLKATYQHLDKIDYPVLFLSTSTLMVTLVCRHFFKKSPYALIAMLYGGVAGWCLTHFGNVANLHMVGALPSGLPAITQPEFSGFDVRQFFSSAIALATLGLIQSVSISKTIAIKTNQTIDANQEFIGQGLANIACSFMSGFFSSSSFTRTGVNYTAGGKTPLSSIMASGLILLLLIFASEITAYLPTATMSAIILFIGYQLIDFRRIKKIITTTRTETAVFFVTLLSTLVLSLEFAIYGGMFLSLIFYLQKTSTPEVFHLTVDKLDPYHRLIRLRHSENNPYPYLEIVRVDGSIFFGSVEHIRKAINVKGIKRNTYLLLVGESINLIDISGAELLTFIRKVLKKRGGDLFFSSLTPEVRRYLVKSPYWEQLGGKANVFNYQAEAISAVKRLAEEKQYSASNQ